MKITYRKCQRTFLICSFQISFISYQQNYDNRTNKPNNKSYMRQSIWRNQYQGCWIRWIHVAVSKETKSNEHTNKRFLLYLLLLFIFFFEHNAQHKSYHWLQLASSCVCFILTHFFSCVSFPIGCRFAVEQTFLTKYANSVVYLLVRFFFKSDKNTPQRKKNALVYNERTQISQP